MPEYQRILDDKHNGRARPILDERSRALQAVANMSSRIFIVIDAPDLC
jgi:hypothetical protein